MGDVAQQSGLATPVATDKTVLAPIVNVKLGVFQKDEFPVGYAQVVGVDVASKGGVLFAVAATAAAGVVDLAAEEGVVNKTFLLALLFGSGGILGGSLLKSLTAFLFVLFKCLLINICWL